MKFVFIALEISIFTNNQQPTTNNQQLTALAIAVKSPQ
jgi:hypothetical protein